MSDPVMVDKTTIRAAFLTLDKWFDSKGARTATPQVSAQIQGAHAALAFVLGKKIPGTDFKTNIAVLNAEMRADKS